MALVNKDSLSETIDNVNEALFFGREFAENHKSEVSGFIASRFGLLGSYQGLYAPCREDTADRVRFFTGEPIKSRASIAHILGEESIRVLKLLNIGDADIRETVDASVSLLMELMRKSEKAGHCPGTFCCGNCTSAYWRNMLVIGPVDLDRRISLGMAHLKALRVGNGRWKRYPFYHTCLVLTEIDTEDAKSELRYAAPALERSIKRKQNIGEKFQYRRSALSERVLDAI